MIETLNIASTLVSIVAVAIFFSLGNKTEGNKQIGFYLISFGILTSLAIHSGFEALETFDYINIETLVLIMPILIMIGTSTMLLGAYLIFREEDKQK